MFSFARDLLLIIGLAGAVLFVHVLEHEWPQHRMPRSRQAGSDNVAREGMAGNPSRFATSPNDDTARSVVDEQGSDGTQPKPPEEPQQGKTGIITSFEPYVPKTVTVPQSPPPKIVDISPRPPKLIEPTVPPPEPSPEPTPEPAPVKFFETETRAVSVGYVVDCSSSMDGDKFTAVCMKLAESLLELKREQKFFVVFFNDTFFPMTGAAAPQLVQANRQRKQEILKFLGSARASGGTNPEPALQFITQVAPDIVYLLTDGEFSPLNAATYKGLADAGIVVHTIGFETAGKVAVLEEIARKTGGSYQAAARSAPVHGMLFAPDNVVRSALSHRDPAVRREAARVVMLRGLPCEAELIDMLGDTDPEIRDAIREELCAAANGSDFGPHDDGDLEAAVHRWKMWRTLRGAKRTRLVGAIQGDDPDAAWVAASVARTTRLQAPDEFIEALRLAPPRLREELHGALLQCGAGEDFGPPHDATPAQVEEAANRWLAWRQEVVAKEAAATKARRSRRAAELLRLAKDLIGTNDAAVERRYKELKAEYSDTPAGQEAAALLESMATPRSESAGR